MCIDMERLVVVSNGCWWIDVDASAALVMITRESSRRFGC